MNTSGTMVWCLACRTVVWALDSHWPGDLRGILNHLKIPCRLCGVSGNYDGMTVTDHHAESLGTFDGWSTMRSIAESEGLAWDPSGSGVWFDDEYSGKVVK